MSGGVQPHLLLGGVKRGDEKEEKERGKGGRRERGEEEREE